MQVQGSGCCPALPARRRAAHRCNPTAHPFTQPPPAPAPAHPPQAAQRTLNVPGAGYAADGALMGQLRRVRSAGQMKQLLEALLLPPSEQPVAVESPSPSGEPRRGGSSTPADPRGRTAPASAAALAAGAESVRPRHRRKAPSPARSPEPEGMGPEAEADEGAAELPAKRLRLGSRRWADE